MKKMYLINKKMLISMFLMIAFIIIWIFLPMITYAEEGFPVNVDETWTFVGRSIDKSFDPCNIENQYPHENYEDNVHEKPRFSFNNYFFTKEYNGDMFVAVVSQMYMDPNYLPENHPNDTMRSQRCHVKSGITKAEMKKGLFGVKKYTDLKTSGGYFTYASPKTTGISTSVSVGGQVGGGITAAGSALGFSGDIGINGSFSTAIVRDNPALSTYWKFYYDSANKINGIDIQYEYYDPSYNKNFFAANVTDLLYIAIYRCANKDDYICITMEYQPEFFFDRPILTNIRVWGHNRYKYYINPSTGDFNAAILFGEDSNKLNSLTN